VEADLWCHGNKSGGEGSSCVLVVGATRVLGEVRQGRGEFALHVKERIRWLE